MSLALEDPKIVTEEPAVEEPEEDCVDWEYAEYLCAGIDEWEDTHSAQR